MNERERKSQLISHMGGLAFISSWLHPVSKAALRRIDGSRLSIGLLGKEDIVRIFWDWICFHCSRS